MKDDIKKVNELLDKVDAGIKYELETNSGVYKIFKTNKDRKLVLHTRSCAECEKYINQLLDFVETAYFMITPKYFS